MKQLLDDLVRVSRRMIEEKQPYYQDTKKYLNTIMRSADQDDLFDALKELNIHELKQCMAAGVPGDAMHYANLLLKDHKAKIKAYVEKQGAEAAASVEVETTQEENNNGVEGIRSSETGREGDSETVGGESSDSGTP